jgi:hypothetical protein
MRSLRFSLSLCAVAVSAVLGCDDGAEQGGTNESTATSCAVEAFDSTWWNQAFPEQTGMFHVEFSADVTASYMDAVIGLSNGAATKWASLAAIVRFNPQGFIDARDGSTYRADASVTYQPNTRYWFRFDVDVRTHRYSVWFKTVEYSWTPYQPLAQNYAFRTEQASVARLNNVAAFVNPDTSAHGSADVCGFIAIKDNTTGNGCMTAIAGGGFSNAVTNPGSRVLSAAFTAKASEANMDGVIGLASGDVDAYADFAASMRFYTNGVVEARDGDVYRADRVAPYSAGEPYDVRMFVDLSSHTYSVYTQVPGSYELGYQRLATDYRFRPSQAGVTSLDRVASVVASTSGRVDACGIGSGPLDPRLLALRGQLYDVVPLADNNVVMASAGRTARLDANNAELGSVPFGGEVAVDTAGNIYIANVVDDVLRINSFTSTFAPRWSRTYALYDSIVMELAVTSAGQVAMVIGPDVPYYSQRPVSLMRVAATDGANLVNTYFPFGTTAVGLGRDRYVVAFAESGGYRFSAYEYNDNAYPTTTVAGNFSVRTITVAPDGGFVIGGDVNEPVTFGPDTVAPYADGGGEVYWPAFVAAFAPDFTPLFARKFTSEVRGIAVTDDEIAVSYLTWTQLHYTDLTVFDRAGNALRGTTENAFVGHWGFPWEVALSDSGRLYFNVEASFSGPVDNHHPFLLTLEL